MRRRRLGALISVTALVVFAPVTATGATPRDGSGSLTQSAASHSAYPKAAASDASRAPLPFGRIDAVLLALAGVPVLALALRRRQAGVPVASDDPARAA